MFEILHQTIIFVQHIKMKSIGTRILFTTLAVLLSLLGFSQQSGGSLIMPNDPSYQGLKEQGLIMENPNGYTPLAPAQDPVYAINQSVEKQTTQCNCLVPIDNSFQVVPFNFYTPPSYRNDDASSNQINLPFTFCLYGQNYNSLYINNNGNVSFGAAYSTFSSSTFPSSSYTMVAPFWADVDTRNLASGLVYYKITPTHIIVRWNNVGYFSSQADKLNDFQLILTNGNDTIIPIGTNVSFCYGDMQWTTGSASGGTGGFGGTPATVGANKGDGVAYAQFGRFDQVGSNYDGPFGANDGISWLDNRTFFFNTCTNNNNIAPIPTGLTGACDTNTVCPGDVINFNFSFLSPEQNQTTTTTINPTGVPNFSGTSTTGNISNVTATFAPDSTNIGYNTLTFVATDNATPPASTIIQIVVYVAPQPNAPYITGDSTICTGQQTTLSVPIGYSNYLWSPNGELTNSITVSQPGTYTVEVDSGGCSVVSHPFTVYQDPPPVPVITNPVANCVTGLSMISATPGYASYLWTPGNFTTDTIDVPLGNYTVTVTDTNGCTGSANINVQQVLQISAALLQSTNASCVGLCDGSASIDVQNFQGTVNYAWTPAAPNAGTNNALCAGNYDVIVSDNSGCADTVSFTIGSNSLITTQVTSTNLDCYNTCDGQIAITPTQGQAPFSYNWLPNVANSASSNTLCAGQYIIQTIDAFGCIATDTVVLSSPPDFRVIPSATPETCPGFCDGTIIVTLQGGTPAYTISWSNGVADSTLTGLCGGAYTYTATDANGCITTGAMAVPTLPPPTANFSSNASEANVLEPEVNFYDESSSDVVAWSWDFDGLGSSSTQNPSFFFPGVGSYPVTLIATNGYGCSDTVTAPIYIAEVKTLYVPNAFTPNSDGKNEVFKPEGILGDNVTYEMSIFNRWGERIFNTTDFNSGWDGSFKGKESCPNDVYIYKIVLTDITGDNSTTYIGRVSLIE